MIITNRDIYFRPKTNEYKMADDTSASTSSSAAAPTKAPESRTPLADKKVPRYYNPYSFSPVNGRSYASAVVTSQEMMLENLRFTRRQMEKDERELEKLQKDLYLNQYPGKWTNHRHQYEEKEETY